MAACVAGVAQCSVCVRVHLCFCGLCVRVLCVCVWWGGGADPLHRVGSGCCERSLPPQPTWLPILEATRPPMLAPTAPVRLQAKESMVVARCRSASGTSTGSMARRAGS